MPVEIQQSPIKDERDYTIRKGKILEKFTQDFYTKHSRNFLYTQVLEALVRDANPYEIIEKLIEINAEQFEQIRKLVEICPPTIGVTHDFKSL